MPTISTARHESTLAPEQFLEIVCSDDDLVRAEFDAIVAAEWPRLPPDAPDEDDAEERSPDTTRRARTGRSGQPPRPPHLGMRGWSRERSPPSGDGYPTHDRKGR